uniref:Rifin n=1 Tax=Myoviridae sp. ctv1i11 TaxID=2826709 RepID=A0A8S5MVA5_9CAUD|nr:MAG TPA: Rifin [Myoviridae sp. ctv1i11]
MIILIVLIPLLLAMAVVVLRIRRKHKMPQGIEIYNEYGEKILSTENRLTRSLMCVPCTSWTGSAKVIGKQKDTTIYVIPFVSVSYKGNFPTTKFIKTRVNQDTVHWEYTRINNHFFDNNALAIVLFIGEY